MSYNFNNETPIYLQIVENIKSEIILGNYPLGSKIPSVREFSSIMRVNPNTVQKALYELENLGVIYTDRTLGKFVTNDENLVKSLKQTIVDMRISEFLQSMNSLGLDTSEVLAFISKKEK